MTAEVRTCFPAQSVWEVAKLMNDFGRGLLVVVDADLKLKGIVTDTDIIRKIVIEGRDAKKTTVAQVMTNTLVAIGPGESVTDAAQKMFEYKIKRLPVVENNRLVGIISHKDLLSAFLSYKKKLLDLAIGF